MVTHVKLTSTLSVVPLPINLQIHQKADDLGLGGNAGSVASGNAGPRIACCVITSGRRSDMYLEQIYHVVEISQEHNM